MTKITIKLKMNVNKSVQKCFIMYLERFIPHCALAFKVFIENNKPFEKTVLTGH